MSALGASLLARSGQRPVLSIHYGDERADLSIDVLKERAARAAAVLAARGVRTGDRVGVLGPNRSQWVEWAYGAWLLGATVVPVQLPMRVADPEVFAERIRTLIATAECAAVAVDPALVAFVPAELALDWDDHLGQSPHEDFPDVDPESIAIMQFTSGSTSAPKGALISHRAVLAQLEALGSYLHDGDCAAGWAPFFHDLGLITYVVWAVLLPMPTHVLATEDFARDPSRWLVLIEETQARICFAPQSAWAAAFRAARRKGRTPDLSSLGLAWFAAEPIDPRFITELSGWESTYGLRADSVGATYGLAEAVLGVTTTVRGTPIRVGRFDADELRQGRARPVPEGGKELVSSGVPLVGMRVRIARDEEDLGAGRVGEIQVSSDSLLSGYVGGASTPVTNGWLSTGDEGFLHDGELFVTGRIKDLVIAMGVKYHPEDFEWAAGRVPGIRPGRAVAFADPARERVVLLCEPASNDVQAGTVRRAVADLVGRAPDEVVLVAAGTIDKTTSGKLRRTAMRDRYAAGEFSR